MIISLDTECSGLDHKHGARPYLVTICSSVTRQPRYWQWEVNPLTREVIPNPNDLKEIQQYINSADEIVLQNSKFDVHMLDTVIPNLNWDWSKTHDIWAGAHVLDSSQPKDLTALSLRYISVNILPLETRINDTAKECRTITNKYFKKWKLCEIGDEDMPSVKRTPYKADMWLPRALAKARNYPKEHPYWSVTADYANTDSEVTLAIWLGHTHANGLHEKGMKAELEERGLWNHYKFRLESMRLAYKMECKGMSIDPKKTIHILHKYEKQSEQFGKECTTMAARYGTELELPKKGVNDSLRHCIWNVMGLEKRKNKKGVISLDKDVMEWYDHALTPDSNEHQFIKALRNKADVDASISYLREYMRYWIDVLEKKNEQESTSSNTFLEEGKKDEELLAVDGKQVSGGNAVRTVHSNGGMSSAQSSVSIASRTDSRGTEYLTQVRQSDMRQSGTSIPGNSIGQREGCANKGKTSNREEERSSQTPGSVVKGGRTSEPCIIRATSEGDKRVIRQGLSSERMSSASKQVQCSEIHDTRYSIRKGLEDHKLGMFKRIYPNYSPYATKTLRWSGSNPNPQNIGKDPDDEGYSNRSCFAAEPGRELWSFDAKNVELRIPAYKSKQKEMIALFEQANEPPFYGSNHMLVFSFLWPELWEKAIKDYGIDKAADFCKSKEGYKSREYGWTKNLNFCIQYGGGKEKADLTAHLIGAFDLVNSKFDKLSDLNKECIAFANKYGYIETIPDRTVDPNKGYPLVCEKAWGNQVKPTLPLNYQTQGSAMWLTNKVQITVDALLEDWNKEGFDAFIAMQVHDEIVVDMPKRSDPRDTRFRHKSNLGRARIIQQLAERQADDWVIKIPVLFGCDYHPDDWSKAVSF